MRKWMIVALVVVLVVLPVAATVLAKTFHAEIVNHVKKVLQTHFESDVEFSDFRVSLFPRVHVTITGLVMHHKGHTDIPPLIQVDRASVSADLLNLLHPRPRVAFVELDGLKINAPPRQPGGEPLIQKTDDDLAKKYPVLIEEVQADNAVLAVLRAENDKPPRTYTIHHLTLHDLSFDSPAEFHATLTNAVPVGEIDTVGHFGPWLPEVPRETHVDGKYDFEHADMATLKGIKGTMTSKGSFNGPLDYMEVDGYTDIPNFALRTADNPVPLHTDFTSTVDGTNGDVYLKSVKARLLHTDLSIAGKIVDMDKNIKGRTIILDATSQDGRVEDMIALAAKGKNTVMTGPIELKTKIDIPEGDGDLIDRLRITGQFEISSAEFTKPSVQSKVDSLSRRGQGHPKDMDIADVASQMKGDFRVRNGVVDFSNLSFGVPGASITLAGNYALDGGAIDFHGKLVLRAKLSQTTTGAKSFLLRALNPFFKGKNGGTVVAIKITGTKDSPSFGLDHDHDRSRGSSD